MPIDKINLLVKQAVKTESSSNQLHNILHKQIHNIHQSIDLPEDEAVERLIQFIVQYIEHVPEFIEAINKMGDVAGIHEYVEPFTAIAREYFLHPIEAINGHEGLDALMDEAYLAHRLFEELNDNYAAHAGHPLLPVNMINANLIIHSLIGEPFANELDEIVHNTVDQMVEKLHVYDSKEFKSHVEDKSEDDFKTIWAQWPCLSTDMGINLSMMQQNS